jgi:hypothetical protein
LPRKAAFEEAKPLAFDDIALERNRPLLVLGAEGKWRHVGAQPGERRKRFAGGIKDVLDLANMSAIVSERDYLPLFGNRGKQRCSNPPFSRR